MVVAASYFHAIDWLVLVGYFTLTMSIGVYFYRRTRSPEGYTAANRSLPGWVCGLSIFATFLSSISYLGSARQVIRCELEPVRLLAVDPTRDLDRGQVLPAVLPPEPRCFSLCGT